VPASWGPIFAYSPETHVRRPGAPTRSIMAVLGCDGHEEFVVRWINDADES
jgi:hypothetical protein